MRSALVSLGLATAAVLAPGCSPQRINDAPPGAVPAASAPGSPAPASPASKEATDAALPQLPAPLASAATTPPPPVCKPDAHVFMFASPAAPSAGNPVRIIAVTDAPLTADLRASGAGAVADALGVRRGGPPYSWVLEVPSPKAGKLTATLTQGACEEGKGTTTFNVTVNAWQAAAPPPPKDGLWPTQARWNRDRENLYSAWIEALFDAPDDQQPSWPALHEVLRDPKRNFLFDHLSAGEDSKNAPTIRPDCADLPYFLRSYFAFKLRLPIGLAECSRGGGGLPPTCKGLTTNEDPPAPTSKPDENPTAVKTFGTFLRGTLADRAHSGSARIAYDDESADYYPVPLTWDSLRPGTTYADPYGHVLVIAKKVPQTDAKGGVLYAVDGQPDGTVARKRFWRGNFLYAVDPALGGPGWKRFRPVIRVNGKLARLDDAAIAKSSDYGDVSRDPGKLDVEGFYDAMDDVMSPRPLDNQSALKEILDSFEEQVKTRVRSVENGRKWLEAGKGFPASMPEGAEIFETNGAWEDFATPSRDLRLLIAVDVATGFPARAGRRGASKDVVASLEKTLAAELAKRSVQYTRTDGSAFTLTLAQVVARAAALETAYDLNDCVETRWGAPPNSEEAKTCRSQAPAEQKARMETYRAWFHERRRPPRK